jgi:hypothetical protein
MSASDPFTVPVIYTCHSCGISEREIRVRERYTEEDVVLWMDAVQMALGVDHQQMSPGCSSDHCDLKIPLGHKDASIGRMVRQ